MGSQTSPRIQTTQTLLSAYSTLTVSSLLAPLHSSFTHIVLPSSLNFPPRDRESFAHHAAGVTAIFSSFEMVPISMFEDEGKNTVVVRAKMVGVLKAGMGGGKENGQGEKGEKGEEGEGWENEIVMFLRFTEDGGQVVELLEFVDSWQSKVLQQKLMGGEMGNVLMSEGKKGAKVEV